MSPTSRSSSRRCARASSSPTPTLTPRPRSRCQCPQSFLEFCLSCADFGLLQCQGYAKFTYPLKQFEPR
ncbi:hypothetical protein VTJ49DRAFT_417 [Mycothermus thermophilus]|uniref:Uncharacterized protein n=1 Tax=Humicola insolens TaxID=85995 RepID=A0ABR3VF61_HUMIN